MVNSQLQYTCIKKRAEAYPSVGLAVPSLVLVVPPPSYKVLMTPSARMFHPALKSSWKLSFCIESVLRLQIIVAVRWFKPLCSPDR